MWGHNLNMQLCWHQDEHYTICDVYLTQKRAFLWNRIPIRLLATVAVRDSLFDVHTYGLHGLTKEQMAHVEDHLVTLGYKRR